MFLVFGWLFAIVMVYLGTVVGKCLIIVVILGALEFLGVTEQDTEGGILLIIAMIIFGVVFARLSASESKGPAKGLLSCFVAGMIVGIGRLFPLREQLGTFRDVFDYLFIMQKYEYSLLVIGIGIMLFHTFQRDY